MAGEIRVGDRSWPLERFSLAEIEALSGLSSPKLVAKLLGESGVDPASVSWSDVAVVETDTLPVEFTDGMPTSGGLPLDRYIVVFARRFGWPPDVIRRQTIRDLNLLLASLEGDETGG